MAQGRNFMRDRLHGACLRDRPTVGFPRHAVSWKQTGAPGERSPQTGMTAATTEQHRRLSDAATGRVLDDLRVLLGASGEPTFREFHLWPKAIPQYDLSYGRFKDIMDETERRNPGFALAGSYREGVSLGEAIASGEAAAERVAASGGAVPAAEA